MNPIRNFSEPISSNHAENDDLRSQYMWRLIHEDDVYTHQSVLVEPPRTLVQFWDDANAVPEDVLRCMDSWQPLEEIGFKRFLFDDNSARQFIAESLVSLTCFLLLFF